MPRSVQDPITSNRANIDASLNILVAARDAGVKRLVYAGSSSAYGNTPTLPKVGRWPLRRCRRTHCRTVAEQYCQMFHATLRPGDGDHPLLQRLRPATGSLVAILRRHLALHQRAVRRTAADDLRRREHTRDFTYVANVVDGVLRACTAAEASGEVINVATAGRISLNDLFRTLRDLTGAAIEPIYAEPRAGDVKDSQCRHQQGEAHPRLRADRDLPGRPGSHGGVCTARCRQMPVA